MLMGMEPRLSRCLRWGWALSVAPELTHLTLTAPGHAGTDAIRLLECGNRQAQLSDSPPAGRGAGGDLTPGGLPGACAPNLFLGEALQEGAGILGGFPGGSVGWGLNRSDLDAKEQGSPAGIRVCLFSMGLSD